MAFQDHSISEFERRVSELTSEGERLIHDPALGLDERAVLQRANGYLLEARAALGELASPAAGVSGDTA